MKLVEWTDALLVVADCNDITQLKVVIYTFLLVYIQADVMLFDLCHRKPMIMWV